MFQTGPLPAVNAYKWNNYDQAYLYHGNNISSPEIGNSFWYPFRSLFSLKSQEDQEHNVRQTQSDIIFSTKLPGFSGEKNLQLPAFLQKETIIPVQLETRQTDSGAPLIVIKTLAPRIFINGVQKGSIKESQVFSFQAPRQEPEQYPLLLKLNGISSYKLTNANAVVGISFLTAKNNNSLTISDKNGMLLSHEAFTSPVEADSPLGKPFEITITGTGYEQVLDLALPKISDSYMSFTPNLTRAEKLRNCDRFNKKKYSQELSPDRSSLTLTAKSSNACTAFFSSSLVHDQSYIIFLTTKNHQGKPLRFWVENNKNRYALIDTYLSKRRTDSSLILPPMEPYGQSYSFHFDNISIGRDTTKNEIRSLEIYPIPYNYLHSISLTSISGSGQQALTKNYESPTVSHPNPSLYIIDLKHQETNAQQTTLVLSQSYDKGWKAYKVKNYKALEIGNSLTMAFPFLFGKEIKEHVMVNNWENGWILEEEKLKSKNQKVSSEQSIIIVYLPQYLQYVGFATLIITIAIVLFNLNKYRVRK